MSPSLDSFITPPSTVDPTVIEHAFIRCALPHWIRLPKTLAGLAAIGNAFVEGSSNNDDDFRWGKCAAEALAETKAAKGARRQRDTFLHKVLVEYYVQYHELGTARQSLRSVAPS